MRKVDFDTAVANLDDDSLRAMNRNELKLTYAIFSVMEAQLHEFAREHDTFDANWHERNDSVTDVKEDTIRIYKELFPNEIHDTEVWCCVFPDDDMVTAREIKKGVVAEFGADEYEFIDDDRDVFRVKTTSPKAKELKKFMRAEWKEDLAGEDIDIDSIDIDCQYLPDLWSWNETEALVKKSKVKVTIAMPAIVPKPKDEVDALIAQAKKALIQTGLPKTIATELIIESLGVDAYFLRVGILYEE